MFIFQKNGRNHLPGVSFNFLDLFLCGLGSFLHLVAYLSILPIVAAVMVYGSIFSVLILTKTGGYFEYRIFNRTFATGWVAAGVAALYANFF